MWTDSVIYTGLIEGMEGIEVLELTTSFIRNGNANYNKVSTKCVWGEGQKIGRQSALIHFKDFE